MSFIHSRERKKGTKHQRDNHRRYHTARRNKKKRKILRNSGWKLEYPELFELSDEIPYIVRK